MARPSQMSAGAFAARLLAANKSQWVPRCLSRATLSHTTRTRTTAATHALGTLHSDRGEVVLSLRRPTPSAPDDAASPPRAVLPTNVTNLLPPPGGKPPGFQIVAEDAARLMAAYGEAVGDRDSSGHVFLVIDVEGTTAGMPPSRWFYVTRCANPHPNPNPDPDPNPNLVLLCHAVREE
jgi:hypothetical protein